MDLILIIHLHNIHLVMILITDYKWGYLHNIHLLFNLVFNLSLNIKQTKLYINKLILHKEAILKDMILFKLQTTVKILRF